MGCILILDLCRNITLLSRSSFFIFMLLLRTILQFSFFLSYFFPGILGASLRHLPPGDRPAHVHLRPEVQGHPQDVLRGLPSADQAGDPPRRRHLPVPNLNHAPHQSPGHATGGR